MVLFRELRRLRLPPLLLLLLLLLPLAAARREGRRETTGEAFADEEPVLSAAIGRVVGVRR